MDASETVEEPVEPLAGWDGRIVNQKLATRALLGVAVVLLLMAVLPLVFQRKGDKADVENAASAKPSWQPENPAPEASAAPAWNAGATQIDVATLPSDANRMEPAPALEYRGSADPSRAPALPIATELTVDPAGPPRAGAEDAWERAALANRGQSLAPPEDSTRMDNGQRAIGGVDRGDSQYYAQQSTVNRASVIPNAQQTGGGYRGDYQTNKEQAGQYQANQPVPSYRQNYGTGTYAEQSGGYGANVRDDSRPAAPTVYQESVPAPSYRDDSRTGSWQEPSYRSTDGGAATPRGYSPQLPVGGGNQSAYNGPTGSDYRQVPAADYSSPSQPANYGSAPAADYRTAPADYPAQPYRPDYRETRQNDAPARQYGSGYGQESGAYRSTSGYQDGAGASVAPARGTPYYQADRRYEAATGYSPYETQPGEARFQGTIEQAPVNSGSRLY